MKKITDIFKEKKQTISFELFPPKTEQGYINLQQTIAGLSQFKPDFISCTYGAGGGSRDKTLDIVEMLQNKFNITGLAHLTCVLNTKEDIHQILNELKSRNIQNVLALRGDAPADNPDWQPEENNFKYSAELCAFIRKEYHDFFSIGVAGFPEGHMLCDNLEQDANFLKGKVDQGADFVMTQLFFDNSVYFKYLDRLHKRNVNIRVLPGILPITNYANLLRFTKMCGASIPEAVHDIFKPIAEDPEATKAAGIAFAIQQCQQLLDGGAPGLHFYSLNKISPTDQILAGLNLI